MRIDLHLHSTASDGTLAPSALAWAASAAGLDVIALTDHDTAAGLPDALAAAAPRVRILPGIEVSTNLEGADLHILGYGIDSAHPGIRDHAAAAVERRSERMAGMVRILQDRGIAVAYEDVLAAAGPDVATIGRPHLARALVQHGHVRSVSEAFQRFLADGAPAYLPSSVQEPGAAIDLIHAAGGLAVWAHPGEEEFESRLDRFVAWGIDGLECFRPQVPPARLHALCEAAATRALLPTGGSDWHGPWNGRLGDFSVHRDSIDAFLTRLGF